MPRTSARGPLTALSALTPEPVSTSALYDRVGYSELMRAGMIPYKAFRQALVELEREGLVTSATGEDGDTLWSLTERGAEQQARKPADPPAQA